MARDAIASKKGREDDHRKRARRWKLGHSRAKRRGGEEEIAGQEIHDTPSHWSAKQTRIPEIAEGQGGGDDHRGQK